MLAPRLREHGIQTEESDYRIHVGFKRMRFFDPHMIYVFPTSAGRDALNSSLAKPFEAGQVGVNGITGKGVKVPWSAIGDCREIKIPSDIYYAAHYDHEADTSAKGASAVFVVKEMMKRGLISFPILTQEVSDKDMQIRGTDLTVTSCNLKIQIKCDAWASDFGIRLQTSECNPMKKF